MKYKFQWYRIEQEQCDVVDVTDGVIRGTARITDRERAESNCDHLADNFKVISEAWNKALAKWRAEHPEPSLDDWSGLVTGRAMQ